MGHQTMPMDVEYLVYVRILPSGRELELSLPAHSSGQSIIQSLLDEPDLDFEKRDGNGQEYNFKLTSKGTGKEVGATKTLFEAGVNNGDTLILSPELIAG